MPLLEMQNLSVNFKTQTGEITPVQNVSFQLEKGEILAIVGESGSGKSVTSLAIMDLLPLNGRISQGKITFNPPNLTRGKDIAMIFQEPMTSLNPLLTIGEQIAESARVHLNMSRKQAEAHAITLLKRVEITNAESRAKDYPHQCSGGMRQRVMIAMAICCNPKLLIADEPTTALDVTVQAQILALLEKLRQEMGLSIIFITHNLGVVAQFADNVAVMYAGEFVEKAPVTALFDSPRHPYTQALLSCLPARAVKNASGKRVIQAIEGQVRQSESGCHFAPRCAHAHETCFTQRQELLGNSHLVRCSHWENLPC